MAFYTLHRVTVTFDTGLIRDEANLETPLKGLWVAVPQLLPCMQPTNPPSSFKSTPQAKVVIPVLIRLCRF